MVAGRWSLVAGRRSIGAGRPSLGRHITSRGTSVASRMKNIEFVACSIPPNGRECSTLSHPRIETLSSRDEEIPTSFLNKNGNLFLRWPATLIMKWENCQTWILWFFLISARNGKNLICWRWYFTHSLTHSTSLKRLSELRLYKLTQHWTIIVQTDILSLKCLCKLTISKV